jgi:hypothetical protein
MGDDPIHHRTYPNYAEYAVATHELDEMKADGYSEAQQLCFARTMVENLPGNLPGRLNDYASNKTILMESEFAALQEDVKRYTSDEGFIRSIKPKLDQCI